LGSEEVGSKTDEVAINLYKDWLRTVRDLFRSAGQPLPDDMDMEEAALQYFLQTAPYEEAVAQREANKERFRVIQESILDHLDEMIVPDIRKRTGYRGTRFEFHWVYAEGGEHIIENCSEYRIPL